jgi:glyoxylase-like metal-dependent hydrolase (beta-lactamase superfamily II)
MKEIRDGLWRWEAPHPDWTEDQDWAEQVGCFAYAPDGGGLLVVDPLVADGDWSALDALAEQNGGVSAVVVMVHWHERDAVAAAERYGAGLFASPLGKQREALSAATKLDEAATLPGGVRALLVPEAEEAILWLEGARTLLAGDVLLEREGRLAVCPDSWLDSPDNAGAVRASLRRALDLPVEAVAVSHGDPALFEGPEALEAALRE